PNNKHSFRSTPLGLSSSGNRNSGTKACLDQPPVIASSSPTTIQTNATPPQASAPLLPQGTVNKRGAFESTEVRSSLGSIGNVPPQCIRKAAGPQSCTPE